jgi:hypothetical protein
MWLCGRSLCVTLRQLCLGDPPFAFEPWHEPCLRSPVGGWRRQLERNANDRRWNRDLHGKLLGGRERSRHLVDHSNLWIAVKLGLLFRLFIKSAWRRDGGL